MLHIIEPVITAEDVQVALENMIAADTDWQTELVRVYGRAAGDARYDARGFASVKLAGLKAGYMGSLRDYQILRRARR